MGLIIIIDYYVTIYASVCILFNKLFSPSLYDYWEFKSDTLNLQRQECLGVLYLINIA